MKVLFDSCLVLDVMLARPPHAEDAARLLHLVDRKRLTGILCATSLAEIHHLTSRSLGNRSAKRHTEVLLQLFNIAPINQHVLARALSMNFEDFEVAVLHEAAREVGAKGILTRDASRFRGSSLPVFTPQELLTMTAS